MAALLEDKRARSLDRRPERWPFPVARTVKSAGFRAPEGLPSGECFVPRVRFRFEPVGLHVRRRSRDSRRRYANPGRRSSASHGTALLAACATADGRVWFGGQGPRLNIWDGRRSALRGSRPPSDWPRYRRCWQRRTVPSGSEPRMGWCGSEGRRKALHFSRRAARQFDSVARRGPGRDFVDRH